MSNYSNPADLAELGIDSLTLTDIERVLESEKTAVEVKHGGTTFVAPSAEKCRISNVGARTLTDKRGDTTEVSFTVSFVVAPDDFDNDDDGDDGRNRSEMVATSNDWGLHGENSHEP